MEGRIVDEMARVTCEEWWADEEYRQAERDAACYDLDDAALCIEEDDPEAWLP